MITYLILGLVLVGVGIYAYKAHKQPTTDSTPVVVPTPQPSPEKPSQPIIVLPAPLPEPSPTPNPFGKYAGQTITQVMMSMGRGLSDGELKLAKLAGVVFPVDDTTPTAPARDLYKKTLNLKQDRGAWVYLSGHKGDVETFWVVVDSDFGPVQPVTVTATIGELPTPITGYCHGTLAANGISAEIAQAGHIEFQAEPGSTAIVTFTFSADGGGTFQIG